MESDSDRREDGATDTDQNRSGSATDDCGAGAASDAALRGRTPTDGGPITSGTAGLR